MCTSEVTPLRLTILAFLLTIGAFSLTFSALFTYNSSFFAYNGKVHLISALRHCKQRSSTASKKAPTISRKASPLSIQRLAYNKGQEHALIVSCALGSSNFELPSGLGHPGDSYGMFWPGVFVLLFMGLERRIRLVQQFDPQQSKHQRIGH